MIYRWPLARLISTLVAAAAIVAAAAPTSAAGNGTPTNDAFKAAASESGVPAALLQALCYQEGRLSSHGGSPSIDGGYGCMHLVKNDHGDTLAQAARDLGVGEDKLIQDQPTNIRGGAAVLRDEALAMSPDHRLPAGLAGWYGAAAAYSHASSRGLALSYADVLYKQLNEGFNAETDRGEPVSLTAQVVTPDAGSAATLKIADAPGVPNPSPPDPSLPNGCRRDANVDYPGAIDCIVDPATSDCNPLPDNAPCTYNGANRPHDFDVKQIVFHDIEGTVRDALNDFQDPKKAVSVQYIVDTDGTVYQTLHDKDVPFGAGNLWYNQHSINIEHAGFAATGFQWYNATQYLASAKLVAHLLHKYGLPADHDHVIGHQQVPGPNLANTPNHVDPGPYWLTTYYLDLIQQQGAGIDVGVDVKVKPNRNVITIVPPTDRRPLGKNGTETPANFNYFYLYKGPSTASGLIPQLGTGTDVLDVTNNVETQVGYVYLNQVKDPAGSGMTMYEIWYGEFDQAHTGSPSKLQTGQRAWLAVPAGSAHAGDGRVVSLSGPNGDKAEVYGRPTTVEDYHIGDLPAGAVLVSAYSVTEDGTANLWYEINFNHRQAWVPASEVTLQ